MEIPLTKSPAYEVQKHGDRVHVTADGVVYPPSPDRPANGVVVGLAPLRVARTS
jgi:hypothetical protein